MKEDKNSRETKNEECLETMLDSVDGGFSADPFWDNLDVKDTVVIDGMLPIDAYNPARVVDLAKAHSKVTKHEEGSEIYNQNKEIVDNFNQTLLQINKDVRTYRKLGDKEKTKEFQCLRNYMISLDEKAKRLSDRIGNTQKDYDVALAKEEKRWKGKTTKLERDKERAIEKEKMKNETISDIGELVQTGLPGVISAMAAYNIPGEDYVKFSLMTVAFIGTNTVATKIRNYFKKNRINKIVDEYEPKFKEADKDHYSFIETIDTRFKKRYGRIYRRSIAESVRETARYFPDAVIIARKSITPADVNRDASKISSKLEVALNQK